MLVASWVKEEETVGGAGKKGEVVGMAKVGGEQMIRVVEKERGGEKEEGGVETIANGQQNMGAKEGGGLRQDGFKNGKNIVIK